jgi:hypothetical protein
LSAIEGVTEKGATEEKYIHLIAEKSERTWQELWFSMADMDSTRYEAIKGTDIIEFYTLFDSWKTKIEAKNAAMEEQNRKRK